LSRVDGLLIGEIFRVLAEFQPLQTTLETIAATVRAWLGFRSCAILLERSGADLLMIEGAAGLASGYVDAVNRSHPIRIEDPMLSEGPSSHAFRTGQPVIVEDTETDPRFRRWRALARQHGIRSLIAVPLCSRGSVIGTLNGYQGEPRRYRDEEVQALLTVATQAGIAIEIARMVETQKQTIRRLGELTAELEEQHRLLERAAEIHDALTQLVLTNQGIPTIARTLARLVDRPVLVQDQFLRVVCEAHPTEEPATALTPLTQELLSSPGLRLGQRDARGPFELPALPERGLDHPCAVAPIVAGRDLLGYVSLALAELPAPPLTMRTLAHAATVLALAIVKDRLAHEIELRVRHGFAEDLIAGRFDDAQLMRDRGRYLGYDLRGPFQVLVFDIDHESHDHTRAQQPEAGIDRLRQRFFSVLQSVAMAHAPHVLIANRHGNVAVILTAVEGPRASAADAIVHAVQHAVARALPDLSVSVGIGRVTDHLGKIATSYQEAERALRVIRRFGGQAKVLRYTDIGAARLLFHVNEPAELIDFARQRLGPVLAYDQRHGGILIQALEAYLDAGQSVPLAAEQLSLHPNTLRYRLRKVEELLGAPLADVSLLLDIQLARMILRLVDQTSTPSPAV
jgi:sugar diacid utilization regulator